MEAVPTSQTDIKGYGGVETHLGEAAITRLPATLFYDINPELVNALTTVQLLAHRKTHKNEKTISTTTSTTAK
jgi:hypothetical protein